MEDDQDVVGGDAKPAQSRHDPLVQPALGLEGASGKHADLDDGVVLRLPRGHGEMLRLVLDVSDVSVILGYFERITLRLVDSFDHCFDLVRWASARNFDLGYGHLDDLAAASQAASGCQAGECWGSGCLRWLGTALILGSGGP